MSDPLTKTIKNILRDPIEQVGVTLPTAALVAIFFIYRHQIHPALQHLPDPFDASIGGALVFLFLSLIFSLAMQRLSRDLINSIYNRFYRDRKRQKTENWFRRAQTLALSTNDPLLSRYREALDRLRDNKNPIVAQVDALHIRCRIGRSLSLSLAIFTLLLLSAKLVLLAAVCGLITALMISSFCKERWAASELVYQGVCETYYRQERRVPIWNVPGICSKTALKIGQAEESDS